MTENKGNTRIKLLKIWEILTQESDEEHPLSSLEIIDKLQSYGISCDRRTLYSDIEALNAFGYEVMSQRSATNEYWVAERSFDVPELHILIDAVQAAAFITKDKTNELVNKLASLAGSRRAEVIKNNTVTFNTTKSTNEHIYYAVNEISRAIEKKKKVLFRYFDYDHKHERIYRKDGHRYVVNPVATVFSNDKYYLVCYNDVNKNITHYRIDRMEAVSALEDKDITPMQKGMDFSVARHKKSLFGMYSGEGVSVKFEVKEKLLDVVFDQFGEKVFIDKTEKDGVYSFVAEVQLSNVFLGWCCAFGDDLKVVAPKSVRDKIKEHIDALSECYK